MRPCVQHMLVLILHNTIICLKIEKNSLPPTRMVCFHLRMFVCDVPNLIPKKCISLFGLSVCSFDIFILTIQATNSAEKREGGEVSEGGNFQNKIGIFTPVRQNQS